MGGVFHGVRYSTNFFIIYPEKSFVVFLVFYFNHLMQIAYKRARLGMSQEVMASAIGVSRQTYSAIETRTKKMSWTMFMALIAVLDMNEATSVMLDQIPDYIQTIRQLTEKK